MPQALVKLQRKGTMVIPRSLRQALGVSEGSLMKIAVVEGRRLLVTPQVTVDRDILTSRPKNRKDAFRDLAEVVAEMRQEAKEKGIDKMTKRQINAAIAKARRDLWKKSSKRPVK